jgi:ATP-dependent Zn protease
MNRAERRRLAAQSRKGMPELVRVHVHEAGHAVIALLNGVKVKSARAEHRVVEGTEIYDGLVETQALDPRTVDRARLWTELKIILAGDLAERLAYGDCLAEKGVALDHDPAKAKGMLLGPLGIAESQLGEVAAAAMNEVMAELRKAWSAVSALSKALLDRGTLTGDEVSAVMADAKELEAVK